MFRSRALLSITAILFGALACGSSSSDAGDAGGAASCPVAAGCPDAGGPSYAKDILPILQQDCLGCHSPGGTAGYDESSYAKVFAQRSPMLDQVNTCLMPPVNGPVMTAAQRVAMTAWFECGALDN
jgi:uncharacterized membrane protein